MLRLIATIGNWLPKGYPDAFRQIALFACAELLYETVRGVAEGRRSVAFANAEMIMDIERATGTFFEPSVQAFFIAERWIVDLANFLYMNSHFVLTTAFLVWLYIWRNDNFYFVRNMFIVAMGLALIGYTLLPTAPPRLFPEYGFVDTINDFSQVNHDSALVKLFINPYAAVPSMHCAFALMIGVPGAILARRRWAKVAWACYPLLVFWVVVVTGNHFWLDAAAGALVAATSALIAARVLGRIRPGAWAWSQSRGGSGRAPHQAGAQAG